MNTPVSAQSIPNHLAWAIVSTILATCFCCPVGLLGIVAIVYATQVNSKLNAGDIEGARRASENAKIWCWVATALAIVGVLWSAWWFTTGGMAAFMEQMQMMQNMQ
ncbi:CD225/dispanin family protein [Vulcaniibacterium thermophilum]|jgi:hypothetical protein|uniref:Membrane protein n=1 Tax=Vulcaniibacterium thermophilum TaxID=1169913 RepID=A0A918ZC79_9GAMM|nr:CD225/dispanin family protein [Vulcaniibacterium thermophilum]GHE44092.1 membrane protein [Vulcaniibacterium thermophilum]